MAGRLRPIVRVLRGSAVCAVAVVLLLVVLGASRAGARLGSVSASPRGVPQCRTAQLTLRLVRTGVAAGSVGDTTAFKNTSPSRCSLDGYPLIQMLAASGRPIATIVHQGASVTVPTVKVRLVSIAPGATAMFYLGFADATGYGTEKCPSSARVNVTPPGALTPITVAWRLQPYGGTVQHLRCGLITVSPVFAAR